MTADRELLEGAAKAVGHEWDDYCEKLGLCYYPNKSRPECASWNPLTDDGDAFRLMVKLELDLWVGAGGTEVEWGKHHQSVTQITENDDPYAATRRAITRAAYKIGKEKKDE